jgi:hypothetical protein
MLVVAEAEVATTVVAGAVTEQPCTLEVAVEETVTVPTAVQAQHTLLTLKPATGM